MKLLPNALFLLLLLFAAQSLQAADSPIRLSADQLSCSPNNPPLLITKTDGTRIKGYCVVTSPSGEISVGRGTGMATVKLSDVRTIRMRRRKGGHLEGFRENFGDLLLCEAIFIPSVAAPLALAAIPVTLAGGAVVAGVGGVRNLIDRMSGTQEVILQP